MIPKCMWPTMAVKAEIIGHVIGQHRVICIAHNHVYIISMYEYKHVCYGYLLP